ncbi:BRCT domain-containing protein 1 [Elsinoe australis]|uniref:BRCT domain-containing protein 1 n=1 Tax=Elsinoe australis TaxID=40998 RepID=A0A4U7BDT3_9PEZI|nr:BRCT domain-containing protein 1 [Elsinoe australis]
MASVEDSPSLESQRFNQIQAFMLQQGAAHTVFEFSEQLRPPKSPIQIASSPQNRQQRCAPHGKRHIPVALRFAPDMGAIMADSSPQHHIELTRATTFGGFENGSFAGDTQPMPSQVYRDYQTFAKESAIVSRDGTSLGRDRSQGLAAEEAETQMDATPARDGMVDFREMWKSQTQHTERDNIPAVDIHSIHESVEDDNSPGIPSSLRRESYLKTPALAGLKRNRNGETISPTTASKTPGSALSNIFGHKPAQPLMTATQMFDNTQAMTSPAGDLIRSDPVETRPSPNFLHAHTVSPSIHALSSPSKPMMTGPREFYKPMDESQERRDAIMRLQREQTNPISSSKVTFDDDSQVTTPGNDYAITRQQRYQGFSSNIAKRTTSKITRTRSEVLPKSNSFLQPNVGKVPSRTAQSEVVEVPDDNNSSSDADESVYDYDEFGEEIVASQRKGQSQEEADDEEIIVSDREEADMEVAGSPEPDLELEGAIQRSSAKARSGHPPRVDSSQEASSTNPAFAIVANSQTAGVDMSYPPPPRMTQPSSISSYVPGSQLPLASSQWRPILEAPINSSKFSSIPRPPVSSQVADSESEPANVNIPSSPPVLIRDNSDINHVSLPEPNGDAADHDVPDGEDEDDANAGPKEQIVGKAAAASSNPEGQVVFDLKDTGPQSNDESIAPGNATTKAAMANTDSAKTSMFETAATHISASQPQSSSRSRRMVSESPQKIGGGRRLADIANDPTTPDSIGDIDISIGMDIMTKDDEDFLTMMKSPVKASKAKNVYGKRQASKRATAKPVEPAKAVEPAEPAEHIPPSPPSKAMQPPTHAERKPAEQPSPAPVEAAPAQEESSPDMPARKRRKSRKAKEGAQSATTASTDGGKDTIDAIGETNAAVVSRKPKQKATAATPATTHQRNPSPPARIDDIAVEDEAPADLQEQNLDPTGNEGEVDEPMPDAAGENSLQKTSQPSRNRVLAFFSGNLNAYYPATCTSVSGGGSTTKYHVHFDDGTETELERHLVCAFDLQIDDIVKIDLPNMRTHMYTISGFDEPSEPSQQSPLPDINGHCYIQVQIKSAPGTKKASKGGSDIVTVPTSSIKITPSMWSKFNIRTYTHPQPKTDSRLGTPALSISTPATPSSRSRRQTLNSGHLPVAIPSPFPRPLTSTIFTNMAFAISYASSSASDAARDRTINQITTSGGTILHSGLHELFTITLSSTSSSTSTSTSTSSAPASTSPLQLRPEASQLGFVALIADSYSRTQKYIQALSLSLPTLHHRWVSDSLQAGKALPWGKYLLPAGESSFLGAVRSRTLVPYDPVGAKLKDLVEGRERLLGNRVGVDGSGAGGAGGGVLLLGDDSKSKGRKADKREVYAFLSLALGAEKVGMVEGVEDARKELAGGGWRWVHCAAERVGKVAKLLGGEGASALEGVKGAGMKGRKRKRSSLASAVSSSGGGGGGGGGGMEGEEQLSVVSEGGVRVVSDEFVIQSLILGALVEE